MPDPTIEGVVRGVDSGGFARVLELIGVPVYAGESGDFMETPLQEFVDRIADGTLRVVAGKTFRLADIVAAHRVIQANTAGGKIVALP